MNLRPSLDATGLLLLRCLPALLMLPHGVHKLVAPVQTASAMASLLTAHGLPAALAWGVFVGEVVAPLLLLVGLFSRASAFVFVVNMAFAVHLAHAADLLKFNERTGGYALELHALYAGAALASLLLGPGRFSVDARWFPRSA